MDEIYSYQDLIECLKEKKCSYEENNNKITLNTLGVYFNSSCKNHGYIVDFLFKDNNLYKVIAKEMELKIHHIYVQDNGKGFIDFNLYNDELVDILKTVGTY